MALLTCNVCGFDRGIRTVVACVNPGLHIPLIELHLCGDHFNRVYAMLQQIKKGNPKAIAALTL